jgi:ribosomal protein S18 acetylase RimI-like enzyme
MTVETAKLLAQATSGDWTIERSEQATPSWFACYWRTNSDLPLDSREALVHLHTLLVPSTASSFVLLRDGRDDVATGQVVLARGWGGLQCIATSPAHRRRGAAGEVLHQLAAAASLSDASTLYLVVLADNASAISLYARLGFAVAHEYRYFTR